MEESLNKLGIIVLNYNSSKLTVHAIECLLQLKTEAEIIVVDNCSNDNSEEVLKDRLSNISKVHLVFSKKNSGYAAGNNIGIYVAEKLVPEIDTVLIMNPDIEVTDRKILCKMYNTLKNHNEIGALTVKTIFNGIIREPNDCAWHFMTPQYMALGGTLIGKRIVRPLLLKKEEEDPSGLTYVDVVQGCFFMIRLKVLKKVGYLDEHTFLYTEESILAKRLENIGVRNAVLNSYCIKHNHHEKSKKLIKYENKIFDMKCYYDSRKYYIWNYSKMPKIFCLVSEMILNADFFIKKFVLHFATRLFN